MRKNNIAQQHRRYQLHRHLKKFTKLSVKTRQISISENQFSGLTARQQRWIKEIRDKYQYAIQTEIE